MLFLKPALRQYTSLEFFKEFFSTVECAGKRTLILILRYSEFVKLGSLVFYIPPSMQGYPISLDYRTVLHHIN